MAKTTVVTVTLSSGDVVRFQGVTGWNTDDGVLTVETETETVSYAPSAWKKARDVDE